MCYFAGAYVCDADGPTNIQFKLVDSLTWALKKIVSWNGFWSRAVWKIEHPPPVVVGITTTLGNLWSCYTLIESDRMSKLKFMKGRECIHSKATRNTSRTPPGSTLLIQFKIIQEFLYLCGQPSKWSPDSLGQECTLDVRSCHNRGLGGRGDFIAANLKPYWAIWDLGGRRRKAAYHFCCSIACAHIFSSLSRKCWFLHRQYFHCTVGMHLLAFTSNRDDIEWHDLQSS